MQEFKIMIFVEGDDDINFLISILNDLKKNDEISIDGNINFKNYIQKMNGKKKLLNSNNEKYKKLSKVVKKKFNKALFIFDCDFEQDDEKCNGLEKSQKCFDKLIKELNWNIEIDNYIFDKNLDYFLLQTINDKKCYDEFDKLVKCLEIEEIKPNKKPIANLYRDLYPYPKFNYKDDRFTPLKDKLIKLFN